MLLLLHFALPQVRPFILHRWGGLGNHRYQAGFSGDVYPVRLAACTEGYCSCQSAPTCKGQETQTREIWVLSGLCLKPKFTLSQITFSTIHYAGSDIHTG